MVPERGSQILYLSRCDIEALELSLDEVRAAVETSFREKAAGKVEMPPKPGVHPRPNAFIHAMPAYLAGLGAVGVKWVSGYPENHRLGLPYISGLLILNCPETGVPLAVMDCSWITEKRTAGATAFAVQRLAVKEARYLAIIGAGVQGRANTAALLRVCPCIEKVTVFDPVVEARKAFERDVSRWGLKVEQAETPQIAVSSADIIVTCAPIVENPDPTIGPECLKPGCVAVSLDFDASIKVSAAQAADGMWVDDGGQFEYYRGQGHFTNMPVNYKELAVLAVEECCRRKDEDRYLVINLGLALEDIAVAAVIYKRAIESGAGTSLPC